MTGQATCGLGSETAEEHNKRGERAREFWRKYYEERCAHEWHADQDRDCNFCVKCGARQEK